MGQENKNVRLLFVALELKKEKHLFYFLLFKSQNLERLFSVRREDVSSSFTISFTHKFMFSLSYVYYNISCNKCISTKQEFYNSILYFGQIFIVVEPSLFDTRILRFYN